jgi:hypothetical protein
VISASRVISVISASRVISVISASRVISVISVSRVISVISASPLPPPKRRGQCLPPSTPLAACRDGGCEATAGGLQARPGQEAGAGAVRERARPWIASLYHVPALGPCITSLHHVPASRPCITSLYHVPVSRPCITSLYHVPGLGSRWPLIACPRRRSRREHAAARRARPSVTQTAPPRHRRHTDLDSAPSTQTAHRPRQSVNS